MSEDPRHSDPVRGAHPAHVVVLGVTPAARPFRPVEILGTPVGRAHGPGDVLRLAREHDLHGLDLEDPRDVRWVGGGPDHWESPPVATVGREESFDPYMPFK